MLGIKTVKAAIKNGQIYNIKLQEDTKVLDEVVVVGYGVQKKESLTGAIAAIGADEIATTKTENLISNIQGKMPGLLIRQKTGEPGTFDNMVSIRGYGDPLVVIDGVAGGDIRNLAAQDIESMTVLKDAASAAIYGAQAANGVIIITTKRAKKGEVKIDFEGSLTAQTFTTNYDLLDANQWGDVYWQAYKNTYGTHPNSLIYGNGEQAQLNTTTPYFTGANGQTYTAANTDWLDVMYKTA